MNSLDFESSKFCYFLNKLADDSFNVSIKNGELIVIKNSALPEGSLDERISGLVSYINSHVDNLENLNESQKKLIKKIQTKFSIGDKLERLLNPSNIQQTQSFPSPPICLQVAPIPKERKEFESNLRLVLEHFPKYQLHHDLSVFDSTFNSIPQDWNFDRMKEALLAEFNRYAQEDANLTLIHKELLSLLKVAVPIKMSIIIETSPIDTENEAMLFDCANSIKHGIPCLLNREFFQIQTKNIKEKNHINFDNVDIYVQKDGDLCAIIPKGKSLAELGFNAGQFELSKGEHWKTSGRPLKLSKDIKSVLVEETDTQRFFRLVSFSGHGSYPGYPQKLDIAQQGYIAGIEAKEFQETLLALKERNLVFMFLRSCYSGGTNLADIHLPDQTLPCPIYVESSFDVSVNVVIEGLVSTQYDTTIYLDAAQKMIFTSKSQSASFPRQLTKTDRQQLTHVIKKSIPAHKFSNMGTLLLPTNKQDIPKVAYALADPKEILDVNSAQRDNQNPLEDKNLNRKAYLFSDPIVPFTLKISGCLPMILLSRGGAAQHVIKEIVVPQQDIEDIAKETFNAFIDMSKKIKEPIGPESASKAFFIAHMKCKYEGKEVQLSQVVIVNDMNKREILFKLENEQGFRKISFVKTEDSPPGYPWKKSKSEILSSNEALKTIYMAAATSIAPSRALLQTTAGRRTQRDVIEALEQLFLTNQLPHAAKLYSFILKESNEQSKQMTSLNVILNNLKQEYSDAPQELHGIMRNAWEMADKLNLSKFKTLIEEVSYTPLIQAVKDGNLERLQTLLKEAPQTLEDTEMSENTPVMIALREAKFEIAKFLIEKGANLHHSNTFGMTPFAFACRHAQIPFVEWILENRNEFKGEGGAKVFRDIINDKNWSAGPFMQVRLIQILTKYHVGSEVDPQLGVFLEQATSTDSQDQDALHLAIKEKDKDLIKYLINQGASLLVEDKDKKSPLDYAVQSPNLLEFILKIPGINVDQNIKDKLFQQVLEQENFKAAKVLVKFGNVNVNKKFEDTPPLLYYLRHKPERADPSPVIQFFIKHHVDLTLQDIQGDTVMHYAMQKQDLNMLKRFRKENVSYDNPVNNRGETPLMVAFSVEPSEPFIQELLQDKDLLKKDISAVLKYSLEKLGAKQTLPARQLMNSLISQGDAKLNPSLLLYKLLLDKNSGAVKEWFKQNPSVQLLNFYGLPIMHAAIYFDWGEDKKEIFLLITDHCPESLKEKYIKLPTELAAELKSLDILKALIKKGADLPAKPTFETCDLELIKLLDEKGVDLTGETGLHFLGRLASKEYSQADQMEGIIFLLSKIRVSVHNILSLAIAEGANPEIIKVLINAPHLDLKQTDNSISSPLVSAIKSKNIPVAKELIYRHAVYNNISEGKAYSSPFLYLSSTVMLDEFLELAKILIASEYKTSLNETDQGFSSLMFAVVMDNEKMAALLIENGVDLNACEPQGKTALHIAILENKQSLATFLIEKGGATLNHVNSDGNNELHEAIRLASVLEEEQIIPLITLLINKGAKFDVPNKAGLTAKDLAIKYRLGTALQLMLAI